MIKRDRTTEKNAFVNCCFQVKNKGWKSRKTMYRNCCWSHPLSTVLTLTPTNCILCLFCSSSAFILQPLFSVSIVWFLCYFPPLFEWLSLGFVCPVGSSVYYFASLLLLWLLEQEPSFSAKCLCTWVRLWLKKVFYHIYWDKIRTGNSKMCLSSSGIMRYRARTLQFRGREKVKKSKYVECTEICSWKQRWTE